jgi:TorA maturation chaperone TorD
LGGKGIVEEKGIKNEAAETAFQRSKIYRLLSFCFFYPNTELADFLRSEEFGKEIRKAMEGAIHGQTRAAELKAVSEDFARIAEVSLDTMIDEHVRLLALRSESPPYETEYYRSEGSVFSTEEMADVAGFYKAVGMDFVKDRPDHIATELEFMHVLTMKEAEAVIKNEKEKASSCISMEQEFLRDHLGRWVDAFAGTLISEGSLFFGAIGRLLRRWIDLECAYLGVSLQKVADFKIERSEEDEPTCLGRVI